MMTFAIAAQARPVWKAAAPDDRSVVTKLPGGEELRIDVLADNLFRVRRSWTNDANGVIWTESGLNRYGIFKRDWTKPNFSCNGGQIETSGARLAIDSKTGQLRVQSKLSSADLTVKPDAAGKGYAISFSLEKDERIYGFGDSSRKNLMRRGNRIDMWVQANVCNIPIPMAISRNGWGMLLNSTWRNAFDCGVKDPDALICEAKEGDVDFYIFTGRNYRELIDIYTQLTGRPTMLPAWGYGFSFVCHETIDQHNLCQTALNFRNNDMPCDVLGLEPGWMEDFYDYSVFKEWNHKRFYFPYWRPASPTATFIAALKRMGFKLSLWLCCDYDLTRYEEQCVAGEAKKSGRQVEIPEGISDAWEDDRVSTAFAAKHEAQRKKTRHKHIMYQYMDCPEDNYPEGMLPWFEHLKKFVDQGVRCFKLDGAKQHDVHPGRAWANGMDDEEMHNLYPLVYAKQMARGFEDYTGKRAMVYSSGGYAGVQQYVATWAGDTGGTEGELISIVNHGISGHSNQSCDMMIRTSEGLHFGFLQTWSQQNTWCSFEQPWLNSPDKVEVFRKYAQLRYSLMPYLYTAAAEAARTGWPMMRALTFEYPDVKEYDECKMSYLLGPDLLVSAFVNETEIPEGVWYDWRTGEAVKGPCKRPANVTADWGGGLYVRGGAVIPMWPKKSHVDHGWNDEVELHVWPGPDRTSHLYEDDGDSLDYRQGKGVLTELHVKDGKLIIGKSVGSFEGMPKSRKIKIVYHKPNSLETVVEDLGDVGYNQK